MNAFDMLSFIGKAAEEIQKPMTIDEALNILDPENVENIIMNYSDASCKAKFTKAFYVVSEYARSKREMEEKDENNL